MTNINAKGLHFQKLNDTIRGIVNDGAVTIDNCEGQRYIGAGLEKLDLTINGTPGNALACYMNGDRVTVNGNAQDATGDTMSGGTLIIHGSSGDATGYGMRGGKIFVRDGVGYRAGIHMKQYENLFPKLVIGGKTGNFLGEYMAGGVLVVLGLGIEGVPVGRFCATGIHGGKIFIRGTALPPELPVQVAHRVATAEDKAELAPLIREYCELFKNADAEKLIADDYLLLYPDSKNPYKQLYVNN
ncbi:MAG: glutamate synthase [Oscillospiraceae bacterium]|jgi:glutamate synthase domain-containing protein 3|nr:glutamate synthase [Oscillospiraceae bacterium]